MFRIPFISRIAHRLQNYLNNIDDLNITELPPSILSGLTKYLTRNEQLILALRDFRAIHKAPRWIDSNTFFNSWFIVTSKRIIIAKNSSSFKRFRDIPHNKISQVDYETGLLESRLIVHSPRTVDIIEFIGEAQKQSEGLDQKINKIIEDAISETLICVNCESKIPSGSKFCYECGSKL
ncbi:MAG TPA: PH domain-containing protein [Thermodesulfobacteriota bacterium]